MSTKKLAYCICTYNRPDVIEDFLNKCLANFINNNMDVFVFDSSPNDSTKRVLDENDFDTSSYYVHVDPSVELSAKIWELFNSKEVSEYEYLWVASDAVQYKGEVVERVNQIISNDRFDVMFLDHLTIKRKTNGMKVYSDVEKFFEDNMWRSSLLGCGIINRERMLPGIDKEKYKEVFYGDRLKGWAINYFYFNRVCEIEGFAGACLNVFGELNFSGFKKSNHWRKDAFKILCETWVNVIDDLPDSFTNKEKVLKQSAYDAVVGDEEQYLKLRQGRVFTLPVFIKYYSVWKRVTYISRGKLLLISIMPPSLLNAPNRIGIRKLRSRLKRFRKKYKYLAIYGTGRYGYKYYEFAKSNNIDIDFFCVTKLESNNRIFEGIEVKELGELSDDVLKETGFIIAMGKYYSREVRRNMFLLVDEHQVMYDFEEKNIKYIDEFLGMRFIAGDAWT